ncbi:hypothetical protein VSDG_02763 [Cytospora chrysosperma]|uniref:Uncharacterized protein n=1 Tax=Cytospora chrysosperma TaxID=252740 RepID=A0A423WCB9_CYTCH|nr:hypothetical protein VSDG_02763 [Valsa sordida]
MLSTTVGPSQHPGGPPPAAMLDRHIQRIGRPYKRSSSKDALVAKLNWLRKRAQKLFRQRPDPDEMPRGRRRYRDWEYPQGNQQLPR